MLKILWPCLPSLCCVLECWFLITAPNPLLTDFLHFPSSIGLQLVQILKYRISVHPFFQIPTQSVQVRAIHRPRMQRNETRLQLHLQTMAANVSTLRDCHIRHETTDILCQCLTFVWWLANISFSTLSTAFLKWFTVWPLTSSKKWTTNASKSPVITRLCRTFSMPSRNNSWCFRSV